MEIDKKIVTLPNLITITRIALIPLVIMFIFKGLSEYRVVILSLLALQGISDFLDGYLARKCCVISDVGKILDPVADKLTFNAVMFSLLHYDFPVILFLSALLRDLLIIGFSYFYFIKKRNIIPVSNIMGKIATISIVVFMLFFIAGYTAVWLLASTLIIIFLSFISYSVYTIKLYMRGKL